MKTVLMVAPYFVPRRRVGALRPFRFAIHLNRMGYQPVILTIGHDRELLTNAESSLLSKIPIINIKTGIDRTKRKYSSEKTNDQNVPEKFTDTFTKWIDKQTPIDTWIYLFLSRWRWIRNEVEKVNPHLIWATGDPWSGLWLGEKLSGALSKPLIADFRDPWTLANVNLRKRSHFSRIIDRYYEKKIVQSADHLIFTSDATETLYSEQYHLDQNSTTTIYNTFDPYKLDDSFVNISGKTSKNSKFKIHFFGRFRRLSPVQPIVDVVSRLKVLDPLCASGIQIHSYGEPDQEQLQQIEQSDLSNHFIFEEPVAPEKSTDVLKEADLLLLTTHPERKNVIPAKLWDYLITGKPILSIVPNPEVDRIVNESDSRIHHTSGNCDEIVEYLRKLIEMKKKGEVPVETMDTIMKLREVHSVESRSKELATIFDRTLGID